MSTTLSQVKEIITSKLGISIDVLDENKPMAEFGLDSFAQVELLFMIEEHFEIQIPFAQSRIDTLKELADVIDQLREQKPA